MKIATFYILFALSVCTIAYTQNVGIGIAAPQGKLHISGGYATTGMTAPGNSVYINANGASPNAAQVVWGDNTGWKLNFGTVSGGSFQPRVTMVDQGNVGIGTITPNASALLHVQSTNKGVLLPQVALVSANNPAPITPTPATGLLVYNTATSGTGTNIVTPGYYYWDGTRWQRFQTNAYAGIVQGTFSPTAVDLTTNAPSWQYMNTSITLPPGKWVIFATVLLSPNTGSFTSGACWVRSSFSESNATFSYSPDIVGSALISGALVAPCTWGLVTGQVVINNTSGTNKTYYYWANKENMGGYTGGINDYAYFSWGENQLFAVPAN